MIRPILMKTLLLGIAAGLSGCCCGPCGLGGYAHQATTCGAGCGGAYWGEHSEPACDSCTSCGEWAGDGCCHIRPFPLLSCLKRFVCGIRFHGCCQYGCSDCGAAEFGATEYGAVGHHAGCATCGTGHVSGGHMMEGSHGESVMEVVPAEPTMAPSHASKPTANRVTKVRRTSQRAQGPQARPMHR